MRNASFIFRAGDLENSIDGFAVLIDRAIEHQLAEYTQEEQRFERDLAKYEVDAVAWTFKPFWKKWADTKPEKPERRYYVSGPEFRKAWLEQFTFALAASPGEIRIGLGTMETIKRYCGDA